jgi:hypothetical protein
VLTEAAPSAITDSEIQTWLSDRVTDGTLPPPTDQTIYAVYYPSSTAVTLDLDSPPSVGCSDFAAYHYYASLPNPTGGAKLKVPYAVLPRCNAGKDEMTVSASHEFAEAATDPRPGLASSGYDLFVTGPWNMFGGETADMCEFVAGTTEGKYAVTRVWSNANAKIGQQPCVPIPADPLPFYDAGIKQEILKGHPGADVTTDVACYSFGELPSPMALSSKTFQGILTFEFDPPNCQNGTIVKMTIHVSPSAKIGQDYRYRLTAKVDTSPGHIWRGMVRVQ